MGRHLRRFGRRTGGDIGVLVPIRPVAEWLANVLRWQGYQVAVADSVDELSRTLLFIRLDAIVTWLPRAGLRELADLVRLHRSMPRLIVLSFDTTALIAPHESVCTVADRIVPLPSSSSELLHVVGDSLGADNSPALATSGSCTMSHPPVTHFPVESIPEKARARL